MSLTEQHYLQMKIDERRFVEFISYKLETMRRHFMVLWVLCVMISMLSIIQMLEPSLLMRQVLCLLCSAVLIMHSITTRGQPTVKERFDFMFTLTPLLYMDDKELQPDMVVLKHILRECLIWTNSLTTGAYGAWVVACTTTMPAAILSMFAPVGDVSSTLDMAVGCSMILLYYSVSSYVFGLITDTRDLSERLKELKHD